MNATLRSPGTARRFLLPFLLTLVFLAAPGQGRASLPEGLDIRPIGTFIFDAATYAGGSRHEFGSGVAIPEVRLGANATLDRWTVKIEVGYGYSRLGLRDVWAQYRFNDCNALRGGQMVHQFGVQNASAAWDKVTMIEPACNTIFNDTHRLGLMYIHTGHSLFATASVHTESGASLLNTGPQGLRSQSAGLKSRVAWHPLSDPSGKGAVQVGISGAFLRPDYSGKPGEADSHDLFSFSCNYPTRVSSVSALSLSIPESRNLWKLSPELFLAKGPVGLEAQYYHLRVNRLHDLRHFTANGAYATLRGLILGGDYSYSSAVAGMAMPKPGSLEAVVTYNWTDLTDVKARLCGGRMHDVAGICNYYINKYMVARLRVGFCHVTDRADTPEGNLFTLQGRFQFIF